MNNERGFSLVELMIALAILGVGLLALAQMQIASIYGNAASREYNTAVDLVKDRIELSKLKGLFQRQGGSNINIGAGTQFEFFGDFNTGNSANLSDTANYDYIEKIDIDNSAHSISITCQSDWTGDGCSDVSSDYTRYINVKNIPATTAGNDDDVVMKEIAVIVTWEEGGTTRHVEMRTLVGRRDFEFF